MSYIEKHNFKIRSILYDFVNKEVLKDLNISAEDFLVKFDKNVIMNAIPIQTNDSINCGKHCLVLCYIMSFEKSLKQFKRWLQTFSRYNIQEREKLSLAYFELISSNLE